MNNVAAKYVMQRRYAEAEPMFAEALEVGRRTSGETILVRCCECITWQTSTDCRGNMAGLSHSSGDDRNQTPCSLRKSLYEAWKKPERAAEWRAKLPT